ncbi:MAG: hypothetical protein ND866_14575 [Pyrinomonadaceae bacterium]|nr:hypothetical protein [Pyrinomonadaceae bacterium]
MKRIQVFRAGVLATLIITIIGSVTGQQGDTSKAPESDATKLVYADFQSLQNGRPVSKRGGLTRLNKYAQNMANQPQIRGLENADPPSPAPARVTDQDTAAAFEYELRIPNEWAGVNLEVFGQPEKDGKLLADDVSGYKFITMRIFAKGPRQIRVELITWGQGHRLESGYPSAVFTVSPGFNTYKLKLDSFNQPDWATQLDFKADVLKKLTSVTVGVFCDKCRIENGTVVVDNIAFEK